MCNISFKLEPLVLPVITPWLENTNQDRDKVRGVNLAPVKLRESDKIQFTGSTPVRPRVSREGEKSGQRDQRELKNKS